MGDGANDNQAESAEPLTPVAARKKRPLFQYHLSTAIIAMFAASGLLWANFNTDRVGLIRWENRAPLPGRTVEPGIGWPLPFCPEFTVYSGLDGEGYYTTSGWKPVALVFDILIAVLVLAFCVTLCEWLIRRRERRG
ncbi:MAG: hypothetical protein NTW87_01710 [Planctomycetota bacterium]|nr:hypothetical protein [Planctomycetota bacterium]